MFVGEKLRAEIERAEVPGIGAALAASIGVAVLPGDAVESGELLRKADRALYTAKESGRNRAHAFASRAATTDPQAAPAATTDRFRSSARSTNAGPTQPADCAELAESSGVLPTTRLFVA
jgi:predicted signal transduction protein with EAL and GGDEF domain